MNSIRDAAAELAALLEQENAALHDHDFSTTAKLSEQKRQAIERVSAGLSNLGNDPSSAISGWSRDALRVRLQSALAENKRLLEAAVKVQAEVIAVVLRSLEVPPPPQYRLGGTQLIASAPPVALAMRA